MNAQEMARRYGYIRASTDKQIASPETQRQIIEDYARRLGRTVDGYFVDPAVSGKKALFDRDAGKELMAQLKKGDEVIVARLDRLSRSFIGFARILEFWLKHKITMHLCDMPGGVFDPDNPMSEMLIGMLIVFANYERRLISVRTREGLQARKQRGEKYCRWAEYGWRWDKRFDSQLQKHVNVKVPDENERSILRKVVELRAAGQSLDRKVMTFDAAGKGCKHLITDMSRLYQSVRSSNGRWRKPQGAEWYILGRDQAKLMPARSGLGNKRRGFDRRVFEGGSSQRFLVDLQDEQGNKKRSVARRWLCPSCGKPIVDKNGAPINVPSSSKLMTCDGKFGRELPEVDRKECGLDRSQHRKQLAEIPAGRVIESHGKRWRVCACKEPLWQFVAKPKRWPPAVFIAKKMPNAFDYLIVDELHEQKSDSSAQATACGKLISSTRYCLGMTGTLIGGYADHLFPLLFRMSADRLLEEGFEWAKATAFTERYGRIERIVTTKESAGEVSLTTSSRSMRRDRSGRSERKRPVPGVMPALFGRHLMDKAIFLSLEDMADSEVLSVQSVGFSPHAWGWSVDPPLFRLGRSVLPTRVGMVRRQ